MNADKYGNKKKPAYSLPSNLAFVLGNMWRWGRGHTALMLLSAPCVVLASFMGVYLSRAVVGSVEGGAAIEGTLITIAMIGGVLIAVKALEQFLESMLWQFMFVNDMEYQYLVMIKAFTCDYEQIESADGLTRLSKAMENVGSDNRGARMIARIVSSLTANAIGIVTYGVMLSALSPWILLAVAGTTLSGFFALNISARWVYRNKDKWKADDRRLDYLRNNSGDFTHAKDMRLYVMTDWFRDVYRQTLGRRMAWTKREKRVDFAGDGLRAALSLLREGVSYGLLVYMVFAKGLSAADFVLYFGVIAGFASWMNGLVDNLDQLNRFSLSFGDMRAFLDHPDTANHGEGVPLPEGTLEVVFRNVGFRYPGSEDFTLRNLDFTIAKGEKLAIVGLNGAGKTTLVKLLCGLYTPTEGEILINGMPINAYNREDYYSMFAAVFQYIFLLPMSIACNVAASNEADERSERVREALELAGLSEKVYALPEGANTRLVKSVYEDAIDLSGGEMQKLALARALHKGGKMLVLDEPTAALDPIAESRVYDQYNAMADGRTSVFISHRLASTRFCDRIFFLQNGCVAECGSHDELMALGGAYCSMFNVQSHYYKKGAMEHDDA